MPASITHDEGAVISVEAPKNGFEFSVEAGDLYVIFATVTRFAVNRRFDWATGIGNRAAGRAGLLGVQIRSNCQSGNDGQNAKEAKNVNAHSKPLWFAKR